MQRANSGKAIVHGNQIRVEMLQVGSSVQLTSDNLPGPAVCRRNIESINERRPTLPRPRRVAAPRCRVAPPRCRRGNLRVGFQSEAALARDSDEALRQRIYQARRGAACLARSHLFLLRPNPEPQLYKLRPPPAPAAKGRDRCARGIGSD